MPRDRAATSRRPSSRGKGAVSPSICPGAEIFQHCKISVLKSVLPKGCTDFNTMEVRFMPILETKGLRKIYISGDTEVRALDGVELAVYCAIARSTIVERLREAEG